MDHQLLKLYNRFRIPAVERVSEKPVAASHVKALNSEVAAFGYILDKKAVAIIKSLDENAFKLVRGRLHELLSEASGANHTYRTLFNKFPYETPNDREYFTRRLFGFMDNLLRFNIEDGQLLSCGHVIDPQLFDLKDFGVCPICQFEVDELEAHDEIRAKFKRVTKLKLLSVADNAFLTQAASTALARPSSLSADERAFLLSLRGKIDRPAIPEKVTRENLPLIYAFHGEDGLAGKLAGATDIMRLAVFMSDETADLSLAEATKFALKTS